MMNGHDILPNCNGCRNALQKTDVFKTFVPPNVPSHLILVYRCSFCGWVDKIVSTIQEWENIESFDEALTVRKENIMRAAVWDLEHIDNVDELLDIWHSFKDPPFIEDVVGLCKCANCERRLKV